MNGKRIEERMTETMPAFGGEEYEDNSVN